LCIRKTRLLVLLDAVLVVVVHVAAGDDADLGERVPPDLHLLAVEVDARGLVALHRPAGDQGFEVLLGGLIDLVSVGIGVRGEVDVRADDVEEGVWVAVRELHRLLAVAHVVGHARDRARLLNRWPQGTKRIHS